MSSRRLLYIRSLCRTAEVGEFSYLIRSVKNYSYASITDNKLCKSSSFLMHGQNDSSWNKEVFQIYHRSISSCLRKCNDNQSWASKTTNSQSCMAGLSNIRFLATQAKSPSQARQMGSFQLATSSPGLIYEAYAPREPVSFFRRWFTRGGWKRTKEDIMLELKSAYAIAKLRKTGYSKQKFYAEAVQLYKEINTHIAEGDKTSLRKAVTENMYSALKNEIKQRETIWSKVHWELIETSVKIRTLRARMIGVDRNDHNKVFIQLTLEFQSKQKFEAYNLKGVAVAGDKTKEVNVRDIWVFEKSLFQKGAYWRLCGRIKL
ncbi:uncharacterized protein LOC124945352 [Impatiens glandulifera]|uniref:uncharacterized protein LOC124945352 n=1 Tax=Impatiens glandulifera TaxID=253017 RepID=UPI001FB131CB|nr:uncharacterized protein LOC124945352 [Impatiens glandulifera]